MSSPMAGGCETTLEDRIIYSEEFCPLIDAAEQKLMHLEEAEEKLLRYKVRAILETLVYHVVLRERGQE